MMAFFWELGRQPSRREVLHITQMNGRRTSTTSRRMDVGSGSRVQVLAGEDVKTRRTSTADTSLKLLSWVPLCCVAGQEYRSLVKRRWRLHTPCSLYALCFYLICDWVPWCVPCYCILLFLLCFISFYFSFCLVPTIKIDCRVGSTLGQGAFSPQTSAFPQIDMEHCLTNSKPRHIGAKWTLCGFQNTSKCVSDQGSGSDPAVGAHDALPDPVVGWEGTPLAIPHPQSASSAPRFASKYFGLEPVLIDWLIFDQ